MSILQSILLAVVGVAIYCLGRRDGERGSTISLLPKRKNSNEASRLLEQIEKYNGGTQ